MIFPNLRSDLRQALRSLLRSPGYTVVAVVTLGLGIGMSTTSFCTMDSLVLRHLPYPQSEDLVFVFRTSKQFTAFWHSPAAFLDLRREAKSFASVSAFGWGADLDLVVDNASAEHIHGCSVSAGFFDLLKVQPELGRGITAEDEKDGAPMVAVITHRMWQRRFGGDPAVIGRKSASAGRRGRLSA